MAWSARPYSAFMVTAHASRRFAISEYGAGFYDEGVPVWLLVDLTTGVHLDITRSEVRCSGYGVITSLAEPERIADDDPIRGWLAADPRGAVVEVKLRTDDELERFCAVEIVRTDQPELLPQARPVFLRRSTLWAFNADMPADSLPYAVLHGTDAVPIHSIGSGRGRVTHWPKP
jgi:hypothetical protein